MKKAAIVALFLSASSLVIPSIYSIVLPNIPNIQFTRIDNPIERLQRDSVQTKYDIVSGTALNLTATVNNILSCGDDPQGKTDTSCMENRDDPRQKVYLEIYYKPCGFNPEQPLTATGSNSHTITFKPTSCNQVPGTTNGFLDFVRIAYLQSQAPPTSGLYQTNINLTVSEV